MAYVITTRPSLPRYSVTTTEYCGSCVYRNGQLQRVLIPGGYATPKTGGGFDYHYYVCDYLGSVRAVVAEDGTVEESSDYYPYGMQMPGADGEMQRVQPYKFGGKEHLSAGGLNIHDFGPRALYAPAGQFSSADPKCEDYPHLSPYLYCAANPMNLVDPTGKDILILKCGIHMAMLIQDNEDKWKYYSINGDNIYISGFFSGGKKKNSVDVGQDGITGGEGWNTPEDFLNSTFNQDKGSDGVEDESVSNFNYKEGYLIETTAEQDATMRTSFAEIAETEYDLLSNNCVTTVQKAMIDAGIVTYKSQPNTYSLSTNYGYTYQSTSVLFDKGEKFSYNQSYKGHRINIISYKVYNSIISANPGKTIKKRHN